MIKRSGKQGAALSLILISLLLLAGCTAGDGGKPEGGKEETPDAGIPTTEGQAEDNATANPTLSNRPAPGTLLIEQDLTLNAFNTTPVDIPFESLKDLVFRVDAQLTAGVLDYNLEIINANGVAIAHLEARAGTSNIAIREYTTPFDGSYALRIQPISGGGTLRLVLTVMDAPSGGGTFAEVPGSLDASFYDQGIYHTYRFNLEADQPYTIGAYAVLRGLPDTALLLFGPDGGLVENTDDIQPPNDLNAVLVGYTPIQAGEYTAVVNPVALSRGDYTVTISPGDDVVPVVGDPDITVNNDYRANFIDGDTLDLTFDAALGDAISIEAVDLAEGMVIDLYLYSPYGQIIAYAAYDGTATGRDQIISEIQLPYEGRYLLELIPQGSGEATFRILPLDPALLTGGGVFSDETVSTRSGTFKAAGAFHVYQFKADVGDLITLRLNSTTQSGTLDIGFALISPDGLQVTFVDDVLGGDDKDPTLVDYLISEGGTYTLIVYAITVGTGTYEISFSKR